MSLVRQCDNCRQVGRRKEPTWVVLRLHVGDKRGMFGDVPEHDDTDYCSWRCVAEAASLRAHEMDLKT